MKKIFTLLMAFAFTTITFSQAPQKMSYQAVIRNAGNDLVANNAVGMKISILQGSATGSAVYVETQNPTTNSNGLATLQIGGGVTVSGSFSLIDWSKGPFYIKTETDPTGGTNYTITGTSQLLSVPYALYAGKSGMDDALFDAILQVQAEMGAKDVDNNIYKTIKIGNQVWMAENLKTTKYSDGTPIPNVTSDTEWNNLTAAAYCWYNNNEASYKNVYGAMYNWYAVNTKKLCPIGWHVPSDAEWHTLALAVDPNAVLAATESTIAGGLLKETGTAHWTSPNGGATNQYKFTALPGGNREDNIPGGYNPSTNFEALGIGACFWTSTELNPTIAWYRNLNNVDGNLSRLAGTNQSKKYGYSVRCIKDQPTDFPTNGLVAYYPFNGNANDESGNGNNGIVHNTLPTTDRFGKSNSAYKFDSVIDEILFPNPQLLNIGNADYTINGWFKSDDPSGTEQLLLYSTNSTGAMMAGIAICINYDGSGDKLVYFLGSGGIPWNIVLKSVGTISAPFNSWHMFTVVKKGNTFLHYIDGILDKKHTTTLTLTTVSAGFRIGLTGPGEINPHDFIGTLDDYAFYNRSLTEVEISALYNQKP